MNETTTPALVSEQPVTVSAHAGGCPPDLPRIKQAKKYRDQTFWFAMRSSYCRELKAQDLLLHDNFICYVPTHQERIERKGRIIQRSAAVVHNLIFVQSTRNILDPWKRLHEGDAALRYIMDKSTHLPLVVDDKSMEDFIRVTQGSDDALLYLDNPDVVLTKGQKVEIVLGPFKGVQGYILRIRKDRRVVITLSGLVSVALATMPRSYFKIIIK